MSSTLSLHDIRVVERADGTARVPMGQPARGVIPLLMDERAAHDLVQATPVDCA